MIAALNIHVAKDSTDYRRIAHAVMRARLFEAFARTLPANAHAVVVLDGAGWHQFRDQDCPANLTLVPLPPYSPELNPVERLWLHLRERFLSLRLLGDRDAITQACCTAWNAMTAEPDRIKSLCAYPWITRVAS